MYHSQLQRYYGGRFCHWGQHPMIDLTDEERRKAARMERKIDGLIAAYCPTLRQQRARERERREAIEAFLKWLVANRGLHDGKVGASVKGGI